MNGIEIMSRDELEEFAKKSILALQQLEEENRQLRFDVDSASSVDIKVINGWRSLINTSEKEREKWSNIATEVSEKNQEMKKSNDRLRLVAEKILATLDSIGKRAHDNADPKLKPLKLSRVMQRIEEEANSAKSEILEFFIDEPDAEKNEQS